MSYHHGHPSGHNLALEGRDHDESHRIAARGGVRHAQKVLDLAAAKLSCLPIRPFADGRWQKLIEQRYSYNSSQTI
jgi:hypothetical protein